MAERSYVVNAPDNEHSLENLQKTCFVVPKYTGIVSLVVQSTIVVVSVITAIFYFYHVGGYEYMAWNENSTILEPISHHPIPVLQETVTIATNAILDDVTTLPEVITAPATQELHPTVIDTAPTPAPDPAPDVAHEGPPIESANAPLNVIVPLEGTTTDTSSSVKDENPSIVPVDSEPLTTFGALAMADESHLEPVFARKRRQSDTNENATTQATAELAMAVTTTTIVTTTSTKEATARKISAVVWENDALKEFAVALMSEDDEGDVDDQIANGTFTGIEQVPNTTIVFAGVSFDLLEIIRISTLVYLCISIIWTFAMFLLCMSIKCEVLDMVVMNSLILLLVVIYELAHSILIAILLYSQREMSWRTMAITVGSIVILTCSAILGGVCLALNYGWIRYITYMHNEQKCLCIALIVRVIKGKENRPRAAAEHNGNEYALPENTRHNEVPFENDIPIQQFSAF